jgi:hypothetical protein
MIVNFFLVVLITLKMPLDRIPANNKSLGSRLTDLWNDVLSSSPPTNISELWKEHLRIRQEFDSLNLSNCLKWKTAAGQKYKYKFLA